jgi:hypothetical protein
MSTASAIQPSYEQQTFAMKLGLISYSLSLSHEPETTARNWLQRYEHGGESWEELDLPSKETPRPGLGSLRRPPQLASERPSRSPETFQQGSKSKRTSPWEALDD